jgi:hypothetical protein
MSAQVERSGTFAERLAGSFADWLLAVSSRLGRERLKNVPGSLHCCRMLTNASEKAHETVWAQEACINTSSHHTVHITTAKPQER